MRITPVLTPSLSLLLLACGRLRGRSSAPLACSANVEITVTAPGAATLTGTATTEPGATARLVGTDMMNGVPSNAQGIVALDTRATGRSLGMSDPLDVECVRGEQIVRLRANTTERATLRESLYGVESSDSRVRVTSLGATLRVSAPAGTTVTFDGRSITVGPTQQASMPLDPSAYLQGVGLEIRTGSVLPEVRAHALVRRPITVVVPGAPALTGTMVFNDPSLKSMFASHLAAVRQGPVAVAPDGTGSAVVTLSIGESGAAILTGIQGTVMQPGDVAVVAVTEDLRREGSCGTYVRGDGARETVHWYAHDARVSVFDRRTGRSLAQRTLTASQPRCTTRLRSSPTSYFSDEALQAFLRQQAPAPVAAATTGAAGTPFAELSADAITQRLTPINARWTSASPANHIQGYSTISAQISTDDATFTVELASFNDGLVGTDQQAFSFGPQSVVQLAGTGVPQEQLRALATRVGAPATGDALAAALRREGYTVDGPEAGVSPLGVDLVQQWTATNDAHSLSVSRYDLSKVAGFSRHGQTFLLLAPSPDATAAASMRRILSALRR